MRLFIDTFFFFLFFFLTFFPFSYLQGNSFDGVLPEELCSGLLSFFLWGRGKVWSWVEIQGELTIFSPQFPNLMFLDLFSIAPFLIAVMASTRCVALVSTSQIQAQLLLLSLAEKVISLVLLLFFDSSVIIIIALN